MIKTCLEGDKKFGVVLIKSGSEVGGPAMPHSVGTIAEIVDVVYLEGGRMNITTLGREPFRILEIIQQKPYINGRVEPLSEDSRVTPEVMAQADKVRRYFQNYILLLASLVEVDIKDISLEVEPVELSYLVGGALRVGSWEKQALLEMSSLEERLQEEIRIMKHENIILKVFSDRKTKGQASDEAGEEPSD